MQLVTRTLRYLTNRYLAQPARANLNTARANAAEAHAVLQDRRREQDDVDAYLLARLGSHYDADETKTSQGAAP
jgi:hypothetical protein